MDLVIEIASTEHRNNVGLTGFIWHSLSIDGIYLVRHTRQARSNSLFVIRMDVYNMHSYQQSDQGLID